MEIFKKPYISRECKNEREDRRRKKHIIMNIFIQVQEFKNLKML